jgi:hypothetical protein
VTTNPFNPRIASCGTTGRKNWVSGARHVLKLVDGGLVSGTSGNLPFSPVATVVNGINYYGGFTVASENPVYIQGSYNTSSSDPYWASTPYTDPTTPVPSHAAAAVLADAVTLLSDNWDDRNSMVKTPTQPQNGNRKPVDSYYRLAIAGGKNMDFPYNSNGGEIFFGLDGGIGNFLRMLEDWLVPSAPNPPVYTLHYSGSLVSLYYSTYNTGLFKCCKSQNYGDDLNTVYTPPTRDFNFDTDFSIPANLPPGTPMFRDVEALGYRQAFTPRTN